MPSWINREQNKYLEMETSAAGVTFAVGSNQASAVDEQPITLNRRQAEILYRELGKWLIPPSASASSSISSITLQITGIDII